MRKILMFASLVLLGSAVGCSHMDSGCNSCGCGTSACGGSACGSGCGGSGCGSSAYHQPCTFGVCDCDIPPLANYGPGLGVAPAGFHGPAQAASNANDAPQSLPQAKAGQGN